MFAHVDVVALGQALAGRGLAARLAGHLFGGGVALIVRRQVKLVELLPAALKRLRPANATI